jgi:hypothetical protein
LCKYHFKELEGYSVGFKHQYPSVYSALSKNNTSKKDTNNIDQLFSFNQSPKIKGAQIKQQSQLLHEQHHQEEWLQQQKHSANIMIVDDESDTLLLITDSCLLKDTK